MRHHLDTDGRVRVHELARELDVSDMTIRRDHGMLVDEGIAQRCAVVRRRSVPNYS